MRAFGLSSCRELSGCALRLPQGESLAVTTLSAYFPRLSSAAFCSRTVLILHTAKHDVDRSVRKSVVAQFDTKQRARGINSPDARAGYD